MSSELGCRAGHTAPERPTSDSDEPRSADLKPERSDLTSTCPTQGRHLRSGSRADGARTSTARYRSLVTSPRCTRQPAMCRTRSTLQRAAHNVPSRSRPWRFSTPGRAIPGGDEASGPPVQSCCPTQLSVAWRAFRRSGVVVVSGCECGTVLGGLPVGPSQSCTVAPEVRPSRY